MTVEQNRQTLHFGSQGKGEGLAPGWAVGVFRWVLGESLGCGDWIVLVLVCWAREVAHCRVWNSGQAWEEEAFDSSGALEDHFCGLEKVWEIALHHLEG